MEHPPEPTHPAQVAYLWSAYAGAGSAEAAVRTQLLHLANRGVLDVRTVGSLSDPNDLVVRLRERPEAGPDAEFVGFLFPSGMPGDEVSLRAIAGDASRAGRLQAWFMGLRFQTQSDLMSGEGTGLWGLVRVARGWGDAMMGKRLKLGRKWSRPETMLALGIAVAVQILDNGLSSWLLPVTYASAALAVVLMPRRLPRPVRERIRAWQAFRRYLREFASLPDAPASAVIVWERYLVYAVALDVADEVEDQVRKVLPDRTLASMARGGILGVLGLGWMRMLTDPVHAARLAPALGSLAGYMSRVGDRFLRGQRIP